MEQLLTIKGKFQDSSRSGILEGSWILVNHGKMVVFHVCWVLFDALEIIWQQTSKLYQGESKVLILFLTIPILFFFIYLTHVQAKAAYVETKESVGCLTTKFDGAKVMKK